MPLRSAAVLVLLFGVSVAQTTSAPPHLVAIVAPDHATLERLVRLDVDLVDHALEPGVVRAIVHGDEGIADLVTRGFTLTVEIRDLDRHYAAGLQGTDAPFPALGSGSMGGWFTFDELVLAFDALAASYPNLVAPKTSLGSTHEGRPIWMWKLSDNPGVDEAEFEVSFDALHHAREPGAAHALYHFCATVLEGYGSNPEFTALLDHREIFVIPCVNPDGYVYNQTTNPNGGGLWRKNRRVNGGGSFGVDLNRNYSEHWGQDDTGSSPSPTSDLYRGPSPLSEPETQAITAWAQTRNIVVAQSAHTYSGYHLYPFGWASNVPSPHSAAYLETLDRMTTPNGYRVGTVPQLLYLANGGATDWWEGVLGTLAITTEMGSINDGFWPPSTRIVPIAEENFTSYYDWAWFGGSDVRIAGATWTEVSGNGNPWPEAGETFDVAITLRNRGARATQSPVTATAVAGSPYLAVVQTIGPATGPLASLTNDTVTVRIAVAANAPTAAPLALSLALAFDGLARAETVRTFAGIPQSIFEDDFEIDRGWTVGSPIDTGAGAFVRVDPVGTALSGAPWQPEDDHTPSPGTRCFTTGNGSPGGAAGSSDCDGVTTLTSPRYDLGNILEPTVSFWLWFANDDQDDGIEVEASNDDGGSWLPLTVVRGRRNVWTQHRFRLDDRFLPTNATRLRFRVRDLPNNSTTEAAVDDLVISGHPAQFTAALTPPSGPGGTLALALSSPPSASRPYAMSLSTTAVSGLPLGDGRRAGLDDGPLLLLPALLPSIFVDFAGSFDSAGTAAASLLVPADPALSGFVFYLAGIAVDPSSATITEITGTHRVVIP